MLNCSERLEENAQNEHLSSFMARMQVSWYDHAFRMEVLKSAKNAYMKLKKENVQGRRFMERECGTKMKEEKRKMIGEETGFIETGMIQ